MIGEPCKSGKKQSFPPLPTKQCCPADQRQVTSGNNEHVNIGWDIEGRSGIRDKEKLVSRKTTN